MDSFFANLTLFEWSLCSFAVGFFVIIVLGFAVGAALIATVVYETYLLLRELCSYLAAYRRMESLATEAQASLKGSTTIEDKRKHLTDLKQEIKHRACPERAIPTIFNVVRLALATPHVIEAGFSILGHLNRRLLIQNLHSHIFVHTNKLLPVLLDRLGDTDRKFRHRAVAAISDYYTVSDDARKDVEQFMRDSALTNRNPRAKQSAMQWILDAHKENGMLFRTFVPNIVNCLEDADGNVRQTAQATVIELFQNTPMSSKLDLQKKIRERCVRKGIESHILSDLGIETSVRKPVNVEHPQSPAPLRKESRPQPPHKKHLDATEPPPPEVQPMTIAEQEAASLVPIYIESARDLEETFREMHPWFEGKEAESNWLKREKSIEKLRRMTKGNAPGEYTSLFLANIKAMLDGILKTVNSLRTTVMSIGCHLVQDLARVCGPGLDNMVEILLQNLVKLCGNTKKIAATKANDTVSAIMANVSYHSRLLQHINLASGDKNAQPRTFSCGWLNIVLAKHGHSKNAIEHSGGLELIEKTIKHGLNDSNPSVRESMRPIYWSFARLWLEKSESIMSSLSSQHQDMLVKHPANPHPQKMVPTTAPGSKSGFSKSTGAASTRPSIKEAIAAQKKARAAGRDLPERPGSAAENLTSPTKPAAPARPATAMSTSSRPVITTMTSTGNLSSAPVRPRRRADIAKPTTTDPAANISNQENTSRPPTPPTRNLPKRTPSRQKNEDFHPPHSPLSRNINQQSPQRQRGGGMNKIKALSSPTVKRPSPTRQTTVKDEDLTQIMPDFTANFLQPSLEPSNSAHFAPAPGGGEYPEKRRPVEGDQQHHSPSPHKEQPQSSAEEEPLMKTQSPSGGSPQRISMGPRNVVTGRKENMQQRLVNSQDPRTLQVYEDPGTEAANTTQPTSHMSPQPRALEELPVNEPLNRKRNQDEDFKLIREDHSAGNMDGYHSEWKTIMQRQSRRVSREGEKFDNPLQAHKILKSAINRISAKSLDVHGFRKLQSIIMFAPKSIWEDGYKMQELIMPLLDMLEEAKSDEVIEAVKDLDIKTQILVTVKLLQVNYKEWLEPFYLQIITSCVATRQFYPHSTHIVSGLEETVEEFLRYSQPLDVINAVLDLVEVDKAHLTKNMSCYILGGELHKCHRQSLQPPIERLGQLATKCLESSDPDVRRAAVEMTVELYYNVSEEEFWRLLSEVKEDYKGLVSYYLARHQFVHKA